MTSDPETADLAIIGAGPAGTSARLWAATYGLETDWLDREGRAGGLLESVQNPITNYAGVTAPDGPSLARTLRRQLRDADVDGPEARRVERIERRAPGSWRLEIPSGSDRFAERVLLVTGTEYRRLGIPGESEGLGSYVSQSTSADADRFAGRVVAVVGGGDAAFEGALQLAERRARVHMLLRSPPTRARPQFLKPARRHPRIFIHDIPARVERVESVASRDTCRVIVDREYGRSTLEVACLFVRIGVDPVYPGITPSPEVDDEGYVCVDRRQSTSVDGLFAAGDVTDAPLPAVATAVGDGATAVHGVADSLGRT